MATQRGFRKVNQMRMLIGQAVDQGRTMCLTTIALTVVCAGGAHGQEQPPPDKPAETPPTDAAKPDETKPDDAAKPRGGLSRELAEQGEQELHKSVRVFQQRYLVKSGRAELQLGGGVSFNDPFVWHYGANGSVLYHVNEQWSVGAGGGWWRGNRTGEFNRIQKDYGLFPERSAMQAGGFAELAWCPVFGKFASFGLAVLQADAFLLVGGGAVRTTRGTGLKGAIELAGGLRVHRLRWLSVLIEVRDVGVLEEFLPEKKGETASTRLMQHVFAGLRLGLWLPPTFQYRHAR
jgi:outer membrane beta-barrel protein